jgi:hypothetical protein
MRADGRDGKAPERANRVAALPVAASLSWLRPLLSSQRILKHGEYQRYYK